MQIAIGMRLTEKVLQRIDQVVMSRGRALAHPFVEQRTSVGTFRENPAQLSAERAMKRAVRIDQLQAEAAGGFKSEIDQNALTERMNRVNGRAVEGEQRGLDLAPSVTIDLHQLVVATAFAIQRSSENVFEQEANPRA